MRPFPEVTYESPGADGSLPAEFRSLVHRAATTEGPSPSIGPYVDGLRAGKNSQAYRAHSYHTKVPPEAIERLILHHTDPDHLVIDPFCGSGMTGVAAIRLGRAAALSDLSPAAVHIAANYTTPCDANALLGAVTRLRQSTQSTFSALYETGSLLARQRVEYTVWSDVFACPRCGREIIFWNGARDPSTGAVADAIRCGGCDYKGEKRDLRWIGERPVETNTSGPAGRSAHAPTEDELALIEAAESSPIVHWFPQVPFTRSREMWRAGHTALGINTVADFYTKRNLQALATLRHTIAEEANERVRSALLFAFTGMVNRASKRYQWNDKRPTNVMTGTLYVSSLRYEWNVWSLFERKARDVARYFAHLGRPQGRAAVTQASATSLRHLPDGCADYVFMDPPFGSNIFYADSSLLWEAWLGSLTDERNEIVVNKHRSPNEGGKTLLDYERLMAAAFSEVARIMKPSAYATLQFNNSSDEVWCAIQDAIGDAGLEIRHAVGLDKIHPSIKGVKGKQAKETVASLDALLELRRAASRARSTDARVLSLSSLPQALRAFAASHATGFTTDDAFSYLVREALKRKDSLAGMSMRTVKDLCAEIFEPHAGGWRLRTEVSTEMRRGYEPVASPYGCVVEGQCTSGEELGALLDLGRPAPNVSGDAPTIASGRRNTAFYSAHSYHTKVPPEAIVPFLEHFSRPGDVVLDPFCGSGMTGVAAVLTGRRAVLSDLSVAAVHLTYNHTRPCDFASLVRAFEEVATDLGPKFHDIYACVDGRKRGYVHYTLWSRDAICPACNHQFSVWGLIDRSTGRMASTVRCPRCRRRSSKQGLRYGANRPVLISYETEGGRRLERSPTRADLALMKRFDRPRRNAWFPKVSVERDREMYIRSALHLQGVKTVADFYTRRNLLALSLLWQRIQRVGDARIRSALAFAFTNTAWHGTRMRRFNARGGQRPLTGTLYIPQLSSEANVLEVMRNKLRQLRSYYEALGQPEVPLPAVRLGSATQLQGIPDASVDYVFTDPPFGSNIFYADCNLIWESWLGGLTRHEEEAVVNRSRRPSNGGKTIGDYERLMSGAMREIHRVLKPGAWATLVFHNTDPSVWRAIQSSAESAGFVIAQAGTLDRKQQSHKGYRGRAGAEDVAHFDVIMSMKKTDMPTTARRRELPKKDPRQLVLDAVGSLSPSDCTLQRVHSEVIRRLARGGHDLGSVTFEDVREYLPVATL